MKNWRLAAVFLLAWAVLVSGATMAFQYIDASWIVSGTIDASRLPAVMTGTAANSVLLAGNTPETYQVDKDTIEAAIGYLIETFVPSQASIEALLWPCSQHAKFSGEVTVGGSTNGATYYVQGGVAGEGLVMKQTGTRQGYAKIVNNTSTAADFTCLFGAKSTSSGNPAITILGISYSDDLNNPCLVLRGYEPDGTAPETSNLVEVKAGSTTVASFDPAGALKAPEKIYAYADGAALPQPPSGYIYRVWWTKSSGKLALVAVKNGGSTLEVYLEP